MSRVAVSRAGEQRARPNTRAVRVWCGSCAVALVLYAATANRGPQSQDSGWQQLRIVTGHIEHQFGLPLCHPLHYYLGRLAVTLAGSHLEPALAITLVSSVAGAIAIANIAATIVVLTRRLFPALLAAGALMFSHTLWQHATHTESYAIVAALLSGEWLCLACFVTTGRAGYLLLLALLNGLGIANHLLAGLATPVDLVVLLWAWRRRRLPGSLLVLAGALWLAGATPYSVLVLVHLVKTYDFGGTVHAALFAEFYARDVLNTDVNPRMLLLSCGYLFYNFPGLTIPLALGGLAARKRVAGAVKWPLLAQCALYSLFVVRYPITDQYTFFFPVYMLLVIFAGVGLAHVAAGASRAVQRSVFAFAALTAVWTPLVYLTTSHLLAQRGALASLITNKPYRDGYRAFFIPWGIGANHATRLNEAVHELAGDRGVVVVADHMQIFSLWYGQAVGRLPISMSIRHVKHTDAPDVVAEQWNWVNSARLAARPVVLVPRERDKPTASIPGARWERHGDIYRLVGLDPLPTNWPPSSD